MKNINNTLRSSKQMRISAIHLNSTPIHGGALRKLRIIFLFIAFALSLVPGAASAQDSLLLDAAPDIQYTVLDSLHLKLLDLEIEKAKLEVEQSDFWHRFIPQIHATISFGVNDLFFIDPATFNSYVFPNDAYRITLSLSLSELLNFSKQSEAQLKLEQAITTYQSEKEKRILFINTLCQQQITLDKLIALAEEEFTIKESIIKFNDLRFQQGKIEYDALVNSKLDLLPAKKTLLQLDKQKKDIQARLSKGVFQ